MVFLIFLIYPFVTIIPHPIQTVSLNSQKNVFSMPSDRRVTFWTNPSRIHGLVQKYLRKKSFSLERAYLDENRREARNTLKTHILRYGIVLMEAPMNLVRHFWIKSIHNFHWNVSSKNHVWNNHRLNFESVARSWPKKPLPFEKIHIFFNRGFQTILIPVLSQTSVQNQNVLGTIIYKYEPLRTSSVVCLKPLGRYM